MFVSMIRRMFASKAKSSTVRTRPVNRSRLGIDVLEDRITPRGGSVYIEPGNHLTTTPRADTFAIVRRVDTPATPVVQGQPSALIQKFSVEPGFSFVPLNLDQFNIYGQGRNSDLARNVSSMTLRADLNHNPSDGYEATLASTTSISNAKVTFSVGNTLGFSGKVDLAVFGDIKPTANGQYVAVDVDCVTFTVAGNTIPQQHVAYPYGGKTAFHTVQKNTADLAVQAFVTQSKVQVGDTFSIVSQITNVGTSTFNEATSFGPWLPSAAFTFVASLSTSGAQTYVNNNQQIAFLNIGNLNPAQSRQVVYTYRALQPGVFNGVVQTGTAGDVNLSNNTSPVRIEVIPLPGKADVSVQLQASQYEDQNSSTVATGGLVRYTITMANSGPQSAQNASAVLTVPQGWSFQPAISDFAITSDATHAYVNLPTLQSGETRLYNAVFRVNNTVGSVANTATISTVSTDPNPANNSASSTISIVAGRAYVTGKSIGTSEIVVKNQPFVNLYRFEVRGSLTETLFTGVTFESAGNPVDMLNLQYAHLLADTDGDGVAETIVQGGVNVLNNRLTFNNLSGGGFVIGRYSTVAFEVRGNISSSLVSDKLSIQLATGVPNYLEFVNLVNGISLSGIVTNGVGTGDIIATTVTPKVYTLASQGDLFVTTDTVPVRQQQLLGGELSSPIMRLQFTSRSEPIDVTKIALTTRGSFGQSMDRLELFFEGATTPFAHATVGSTGSDVTPGEGSTFTARMQSQQFVIPANAEVKVLVRARMKADSEGGLSGETEQLFVWNTNQMNYSTGAGAIFARGVTSANNLAGNDGDSVGYEGEVFIGRNNPGANVEILGPKHVSVLSKLTSITNAHPAANGSAVPVGTADIGMFKYSAAQNNNSLNGLNKTVINRVIYKINAANVLLATSSLRLYNTSNFAMSVQGSVVDVNGNAITAATFTGTAYVIFDNLFASGMNVTVDPGTNMTLAISATVLNPKIVSTNTSTLQVSMSSFSTPFATAFGVFASNIEIWDRDAINTNIYFWLDLPITTVNSVSFMS